MKTDFMIHRDPLQNLVFVERRPHGIAPGAMAWETIHIARTIAAAVDWLTASAAQEGLTLSPLVSAYGRTVYATAEDPNE